MSVLKLSVIELSVQLELSFVELCVSELSVQVYFLEIPVLEFSAPELKVLELPVPELYVVELSFLELYVLVLLVAMFWSSPHCIAPDKVLFCLPVASVTDCFIDFITSISTEKRPK